MSPSENFAFVNAYLSRMGPIIRARRGYIDKFMGDGVMALFPGSANDAVLAAVEMQKELHRYNDEQDCAGAPRINVGVGVNTGRMMLGTLGESDRMEGSVISDAVNLASRLEGLTKRYGSKVIISEHTYELLDTAKLDCREIDSVVVKGKDRPVRIFEVIDGEPPEIAGLKLDSLAQFCEEPYLLFTRPRNLPRPATCSRPFCPTEEVIMLQRCMWSAARHCLKMVGIRDLGQGSRSSKRSD